MRIQIQKTPKMMRSGTQDPRHPILTQKKRKGNRPRWPPDSSRSKGGAGGAESLQSSGRWLSSRELLDVAEVTPAVYSRSETFKDLISRLMSQHSCVPKVAFEGCKGQLPQQGLPLMDGVPSYWTGYFISLMCKMVVGGPGPLSSLRTERRQGVDLLPGKLDRLYIYCSY